MTAPFDDLSLEVLARRRSAKWSVYPPDVLPAWVAEMDFPVAEPIKAVLFEAVERDDLGYPTTIGLGDAFAAFAARRFDWAVDPNDVFLVGDAVAGIGEVLHALTAPSAGIVINSPVYPPFARTIGEAARRVVDVPLLRVDASWELDLAGLERAFVGGARTYLFCSPHNPVGRVFARETLTAVAELAARFDVLVIADEIHAPLALPGAVHTPFPLAAAASGAACVVITSASKTWNLAGLKCALIVAGSAGMRARLKQTLPPELPYRAGHLGVLASIAAFREGDPWLAQTLAQLDANRAYLGDVLRAQLPPIGYEPPEASYLAWLDVRALALDDPAATFLSRGRVALSAGAPFGGVGKDYVRVNIGTSRPIIAEIVARMARALAAS